MTKVCPFMSGALKNVDNIPTFVDCIEEYCIVWATRSIIPASVETFGSAQHYMPAEHQEGYCKLVRNYSMIVRNEL